MDGDFWPVCTSVEDAARDQQRVGAAHGLGAIGMTTSAATGSAADRTQVRWPKSEATGRRRSSSGIGEEARARCSP